MRPMHILTIPLALLTCAVLAGPAAARGRQDPTQAQTMGAATSITEYNSQAQALSTMPADPRHAPEIKALRSLADALEKMPGATDAVKKSAASIRENADTLEKSPTTAVHSDTTKTALTSALSALDALQATNPSPDMASKITQARGLVAKIDPSVPFLKQRDTIDQAFVAIGDALAVAGGPAV